MSASNKKKLRKEQNAAAMTEKQQKALKEAKKLKAYTNTFLVCMVLVVAIVIGVLLRAPIGTIVNRNTAALLVGDKELTTVELNYYYADAVSDFYENLYNSYGSSTSLYAQWIYGITFGSPLDDQIYDKDSGKTWGDYFVDIAKENARSVYAIYALAMADSKYTVPETVQQDIDTVESTTEMAAQFSGFSTVNKYLKAFYGNGAHIDTYTNYYKMNAIATDYYEQYVKSLTYTDDDYREYEKDKYNNFSSFTYYSYTVSVSAYLTGGTLGEDGKTKVYSDAEKEAALIAAKADAKALMDSNAKTVEEFNNAIAKLTINKDKTDVKSSESKNILYTNMSNEDVKKWASDKDRKFGDMTTIETTTKTTGADGKEIETVNGIYVLFFDNGTENKTPLANVRHILVKFTGGTTDANGNVTYTDAEKATAETKAKEILQQWKDGAATEDSFAELAKTKSDDTGSKEEGGLLEDITPDASLVENFLNWCFDDRKAGDVDVIETEYGFHVMYYSGDDELNFRDYMIKNELTQKDAVAWHDEQVKDVTVTVLNIKHVYYEFSPA